MKTLLVALEPTQMDALTRQQLNILAPAMQLVVSRDQAEITPLLPTIEIIIGSLAPELVLRAPALRWYQQWGAGADWLLQAPEAPMQPFVLTNTSGIHAIPISEHIIGTMLMFARGLHHAVWAQTRQAWWRPASGGVFELAGKTLLLLGVGAIGARTAALAHALEMQVEGVREHPERSVPGVGAMYHRNQLLERLPHADMVVLTVPLSSATRGMIGATELQAMRPTAYLINIGRGGTVDEAALVQALSNHQIAGAALDVFVEEPLPPESPLWTMENVILTAHYAGATPQYDARAWAIALDNLERYSAGLPLRNVVDKQRGY